MDTSNLEFKSEDLVELNEKYDSFLGSWHIVRLLREDSGAKEYEISKKIIHEAKKEVFKVFTIPRNQKEVKKRIDMGMTKVAVEEYYEKIVKGIQFKINSMIDLKGKNNIVSYEKCEARKHEDEICWEIMIRKELLTPLTEYVKDGINTYEDVIQLGVDLCTALKSCNDHEVVHGDIRPESIFVTGDKNFKLGGFENVRMIQDTTSYIAPEAYKKILTENHGVHKFRNAKLDLFQRTLPLGKKEKCDNRTDIYSLGLVLYHLLNNSRGPFLPEDVIEIPPTDIYKAFKKRMRKKKIPCPVNAVDWNELSEVILKACKYKPNDRYNDSKEISECLAPLAYENKARKPLKLVKNRVFTSSNEFGDVNCGAKKKCPKAIILFAVLGTSLVIGSLYFKMRLETITPEPTPTLEPTPTPEPIPTLEPTPIPEPTPTLEIVTSEPTPLTTVKPVKKIRIPDFRGKTYKQAKRKINKIDKSIKIATPIYKYSNKRKNGKIIRQNPKNGVLNKEGAKIKIVFYVSKGKKPEPLTPTPSPTDEVREIDDEEVYELKE